MKRMKRIGLWVLVLMVLFTGCGKPSSTLELPGNGYTALAEVDGTCYLVENSGIIYTLDWDTGEKSVYYKAPVDVAWVADPDMTHIYYMDGADLHCIDVAADRDVSLCALPNATRVKPILGVTDHYLLYRQVVLRDGLEVVTVHGLDLETLNTRQFLSGEEFDVFIAAQGDTAYLSYHHDGPLAADKYSRVSAVDLVTGEETVLAEQPASAYLQYPFNPIRGTFCDTLVDGVLYYENSRYTTNDDPRNLQNRRAICAVPVDGSAEAQALALTGAVQSGRMYLSTDARLLVNCDTEDPVLTLYRYDAETDTATELTQINSLRRVFGAVTNGQRYAMLAGDNWEVTALILGDLK